MSYLLGGTSYKLLVGQTSCISTIKLVVFGETCGLEKCTCRQTGRTIWRNWSYLEKLVVVGETGHI